MGWRKKNKEGRFCWMKYAFMTAIAAVFITCLAVYLMPFITYYQIEAAVVTKDASRLASQVNFAELRKNLKLQKGQRVIKELRKESGPDPDRQQSLVDLSIQWAALPSRESIDQAISTEGFYISLSGPRSERRKPDPIKAPPEFSSVDLAGKLIAQASFSYQSPSRFEVRAKDEKNRYVEYFTFVFTREGIGWRLTNVILPLF